MALMDWNKDLELEVNKMNDQHKGLLDLMNKIYDLKESNGDINMIKSYVKQLGDATVKHFKEEEEYMESIGYPEYLVHKGVHTNMLKRFTEYVDAMNANNEIGDDFIKFLKFWLGSHIKSVDKKYSDYSKTIKSAA